MKTKVLIYVECWLLCLSLWLAGCSQEPLANNTVSKPVEMRLQVNTPLGGGGYVVDNENAINRLRMVVIGSAGAPDALKLLLNKYYPTIPTDNKLTEVILSGTRDIYIIANEPLTESGDERDEYKNIRSSFDIRQLKLHYQAAPEVNTPYLPTEIPMFIEHINKKIAADSPNVISGAVERTAAKVTVNLNIKDSDFLANKPVVIDYITIRNLPTEGYFMAKPYTDALRSSEIQAVAATTPEAEYNFSSSNTFYVPEYILNNPDNGAYIEIKGHIKDEPTKVTQWNVKLGDAMDAQTYGNRYDITRNRHYTLIGNVKSYGQMDVTVKVTVQPWNTTNLSENAGHFLRYIKTELPNGTTLPEGGEVSVNGERLNIVCSTNIGGWYTITKDDKGTIIHRSSPTATVSTSAEQSVEIPIPMQNGINTVPSYSVGIYYSPFQSELSGAIKTLTFKQKSDISFIPSATLQAAGWTNNRPGVGLQMAKIGNVDPSTVAGKLDQQSVWDTSNKLFNTANGYGVGKEKSARLRIRGILVVSPCTRLGNEWYVPSLKELELIRDNQDRLGPSYKFVNPKVYWTSSERFFDRAFTVNMSSQASDNLSKTDNTRPIRCVRNLD